MSDSIMTNTAPTETELFPQRIAKAIGAEGCYFLSLLELGRRVMGVGIDAIKAYSVATSKLSPDGKPYMWKNCYINNPVGILSIATGLKYDFRKEEANYLPKPGELLIGRYELGFGRAAKSHFVVCDSQGCVSWDPYGKSETVASGKLQSYRVFTAVPRG